MGSYVKNHVLTHFTKWCRRKEASTFTRSCKSPDNGDYPSKPLETLPNGPTQVMESKKVNEVHAMVRNRLNKIDSKQASSSEN